MLVDNKQFIKEAGMFNFITKAINKKAEQKTPEGKSFP
jgi:hypothetical protein